MSLQGVDLTMNTTVDFADDFYTFALAIDSWRKFDFL